MKLKVIGCVALCGLMAGALGAQLTDVRRVGDARLWLTKADKSAVFEQQKTELHFSKEGGGKEPAIEIDPKQTFQTIDGFGFALTGGSAKHLAHMDAGKRTALLKELFDDGGTNIGVSYLRISIGASDLNDFVYSYDDMAEGATDPQLTKFTLAEEQKEVVPVLKEILAINPKIEILGSPWSAPAWMKTNGNVKGGKLKPEFYQAYANYFVKYIRGMKALGITIDAITVQNEPLNDKNTPSMLMMAEEEAAFIREHLGPAFKREGIRTKIILYDHNCDVPEYATSILKDAAASAFVDGSGFHLYGGEITAMSAVHDAFPKKNLYFTEFMAVEPTESARITITKPVVGTFIGALQNWSKNVVLWNLAANSKFEPHTDNGGCPICQGAVTIDGNEVTRNLAYYAMAHFSKFVRPGSVRVGSSSLPELPNVAFIDPVGRVVLVVANSAAAPHTFRVAIGGKSFTTTLSEGAVGTYVW